MARKQPINFRLAADTVEALDELADQLDVSRTEVVVRAIHSLDIAYSYARSYAESFISALRESCGDDATITAPPYPGPATIGPVLINGAPNDSIRALTKVHPQSEDEIDFYISGSNPATADPGTRAILYLGSLPRKTAEDGVGLAIRVGDLKPAMQTFGVRPGVVVPSWQEKLEESGQKIAARMLDDHGA